MSFCPKCGKEQVSDALFCGDCGTALGAASGGARGGADTVAGTSAPNKKWSFWARILAAREAGAGKGESKKEWIQFLIAMLILVVIGPVVLFCAGKFAILFIPASQRAVMAEAPRVLASFESYYLTALAVRGSTSAIGKDDLIFNAPTDSRWFIYEINDNAKTCYAIAKANIGDFKKGDQIATQYDEDIEEFIHGSTNEAAREMIPRFFRNGMAKIGGRTGGGSGQRGVATTYQAPAQSSNQLSGGGGGSGTFTDSRDGETYKTVKMPDGKTWMAQNLNYQTGRSWCYGDKNSMCEKYGRLYNWTTAKTACPVGWHLPSQQEWNTLLTAAGGDMAGMKLKARSGWSQNGNGSDDYGFSGLPGGIRTLGFGFLDVGDFGHWWTATEDEHFDDWVYIKIMYIDYDNVRKGNADKSNGCSLRCVKDN